MDNSTKSFVLIKYEILTSNDNSWYLCKTYPKEALTKWCRRCTEDVEHFAIGVSQAEKFISIVKKYYSGFVTDNEVYHARENCLYSLPTAAFATVNSFYSSIDSNCYSPYYAAVAHYYGNNIGPDEKWKQYINWLIEELCEYESNKQTSIDSTT